MVQASGASEGTASAEPPSAPTDKDQQQAEMRAMQEAVAEVEELTEYVGCAKKPSK